MFSNLFVGGVALITFQYTKFLNLDCKGREEIESYGYRIYSDEKAEYFNYFETLSDLILTVNINNIRDYIKESHLDFYGVIRIDGKFEFNGNVLLL